eukprot:Nk52_evm15s250 gene=Nk52_evmTU15s250
MTLAGGETNVKVALRIRPESATEQMDMCRQCIFSTENENQVVLGKDRLFTFDYVFSDLHSQEKVFSESFRPLLLNTFEGYNVTILAYGQTGSGKTYTMGTGFDDTIAEEEQGCVPRAIRMLFKEFEVIKKQATENGEAEPQIEFSVSFIELYNDEIKDLLVPVKDPTTGNLNAKDGAANSSSAEQSPSPAPANANSGKQKGKSGIYIREDNNGGIVISGIVTEKVATEKGFMECLQKGTLSRTTASTNMNTHSSRSHAVYTVHVTYQKGMPKINGNGDSGVGNGAKAPKLGNVEWQVLHSKIHFVDLAGSERLKRTKASGIRQKEGIAINSGLLALGNVISALGDVNSKATHIPYRDSKLTRLLQDSLGGNSRTLMIACVSPADRDFMETHNTLKYANRARNIRNLAVVNQDTQSIEIASLRSKIAELQMQIDASNSEQLEIDEEEIQRENRMLLSQNVELKRILQQKEDSIRRLTDELIHYRAFSQATENGFDNQKIIESNLKRISQLEESLSTTQLQLNHEAEKKQVSSYEDIPNILRAEEDQLSDEENAPRDSFKDSMQELNASKAALQSELIKSSQCSEQKPVWRRILEIMQEENNEMRHENCINVSRRRVAGLIKNLHEQELKTGESTPVSEVVNSTNNFQEVKGSNDSSLASSVPHVPRPECMNSVELEPEKVQGKDKESPSSLDTEVKDNSKSAENCEENNILQQELDKLTMSIDEKERLMAQLESSRKKIEVIKEEFSSKIEKLQRTIKATTVEKEKALKEAEKNEKMKVEEKQKIVTVYETKMKNLKKQLEKVKYQEQEHAKLERVKKKSDRTIAALQEEVLSMKRHKVKLQNRIKEEGIRIRDMDQDRRREINKLKSESQSYQNQLKRLEMQNKKQEVVLKRKLEEVVAIQKKLRNSESSKKLSIEKKSTPSSSKVEVDGHRSSSFQIRHKKERLEKEASRIILHRKALFQMSRLMKDRENTVIEKDEILEKIQVLVNESFMNCQNEKERKTVLDEIKESEETIESLDARIDYLNETIGQVQEDIVYTEGDGDSLSKAVSIIRSSSGPDVKCLLEHFFRLVVDIKSSETKRITQVNELEEQLSKTKGLLSEMEKLAKETQKEQTDSSLMGKSSVVEKNDIVAVTVTPVSPDLCMPDLLRKSQSPIADSCNNMASSCSNVSASVERLDSTPKADDVFSRLASSTDLSESVNGRIVSSEKKMAPFVKSTHTIYGHSGAVLGLALNDKYVFSASQDASVKVWDMGVGEEVASLLGHSGYVRAIASAGNYLFSASQATVRMWDTVSCKCVEQFNINGGVIYGIKPDSTGNKLYVAGGNSVRVWDIRNQQCIKVLSGHKATVFALTTLETEDGSFIVTGSRDHSVKVFDANSFELVHTLHPPHYDGVQSIACSGGNIFSGSRDNIIKQWDGETFKLKRSVKNAHSDWVCALTPMPVPGLLASASRDGIIKLWEPATCNCIAEFRGHSAAVNAIGVAGSNIYSASGDRTIKVWNLSENFDVEDNSVSVQT